MTLKLIIGNKNYSSWSFRPWIGLKASGIAFDEEVIPLYVEGSKEKILAHSPAGKVPVLIDGATHVWESLAILEYAAEKFPGAGLWPSDPAARAHARSISTEMHAGFLELRNNMPMNIRASYPGKGMTPAVRADIERITGLWRDCRKRFAGAFQKDDGFLFGTFGAADAMYAPVVTRLRTYGVKVDSDGDAYCNAVLAHPAVKDWIDAAKHEPWLISAYELA